MEVKLNILYQHAIPEKQDIVKIMKNPANNWGKECLKSLWGNWKINFDCFLSQY
jgi:hypothetical protein